MLEISTADLSRCRCTDVLPGMSDEINAAKLTLLCTVQFCVHLGTNSMSYISHVYLVEMLWCSSRISSLFYFFFVTLDSLFLILQTQIIVTHSEDSDFFDETKTSVEKFGKASLTIIGSAPRLAPHQD